MEYIMCGILTVLFVVVFVLINIKKSKIGWSFVNYKKEEK